MVLLVSRGDETWPSFTLNKDDDNGEGDAFVGRFTLVNGNATPIWVRTITNAAELSGFDIEESCRRKETGLFHRGDIEIGDDLVPGLDGTNLGTFHYDENGTTMDNGFRVMIAWKCSEACVIRGWFLAHCWHILRVSRLRRHSAVLKEERTFSSFNYREMAISLGHLMHMEMEKTGQMTVQLIARELYML